ncbi:antitoxin MqsA [Geobacter sp. OR-1]|uniref:type II toxin-antitoxin system MqsA family antitoxin n=1 Tax=Geobacter sp. OR-1 TaxID=1266765 RepID=UPI0005439962|nr:type II toxin-antitoxin system MqsA family antitoxin [Geobacter sp. OR-1]GAM11341.1 antitoxin MqsA [Geobacter sp. OR-1]
MNYNQGDLCPVCGSGVLVSKQVTETFEYKGQFLDVPNYTVWDCPTCEESLVASKDSKATGRRLRDFYRKVDGLLTSLEIKEIRLRLGLNQNAASELLGGGAKSFARYENCEVIQSEAMDNLLRVLDVEPRLLKVIENKNNPQVETTIPFKAKFGAVMHGSMVVNYGK